MNWEAIAAIAETVGTIGVLVTLVYLSIQMRIANKQRETEALRTNWDGINRFCEILAESTDRASIVIRGRESLDDLTSEEHLVFEFLHIRILNSIELWYMQLMETSPPGEYRDQQLENIEGVIVYMFNYKGALEIWDAVKHTFVPIQELFDNAISDAQAK